MLQYIFWGIVLYLAIRFIFNFVIPIFRATRQMRSQMKDFQAKMQEQQQQQGSTSTFEKAERPKDKVKREDYIDFEEIRTP
jgi:hypothetical protein